MAISKDRINDLINRLSDKDLELVTDLMERLTQHNKREIPIDDEPTTQDDLNAIKAAHEALKKGELINLKDIEHELRS
ncbi:MULTISPECIES: hypothetical protein [unclassified Paenibacillus]|uniref:hypothetical protein n=1 Tax=unclassified Paenibacillus TaxID=185978 RepID=UPI001AEB2241|nr:MULTISPECIES: hypothetical protein [unclassified Paenibacillus]MBP1155075.1 hypothetical protein [Paenibacillus sp. PvP091]MBP1169542.1 hypothetical protein [Paenibacillus sp. PvR098]MBP2440570.1 hypothetical protein [Paenibacillus sp. PvP052]